MHLVFYIDTVDNATLNQLEASSPDVAVTKRYDFVSRRGSCQTRRSYAAASGQRGQNHDQYKRPETYAYHHGR